MFHMFYALIPLNWKPRPTLLTDCQLYQKLDFDNQDGWTIDEWRQYALFLEWSGTQLLHQHNKEINYLKKKLTMQAEEKNQLQRN